MSACYVILAHVTWALAREWALFIRAAKTVTWALTREWALARDTTVVHILAAPRTQKQAAQHSTLLANELQP